MKVKKLNTCLLNIYDPFFLNPLSFIYIGIKFEHRTLNIGHLFHQIMFLALSRPLYILKAIYMHYILIECISYLQTCLYSIPLRGV